MFHKIRKSFETWFSNNWHYLLMFLLMFVNFFSMHISIAGNSYIKNLFSWFVPVEFVVFDILIVLTLCGVLALLKKKTAYILAFTLTLLWSFCNVAYSRFFGHYLSLSAIGEIVNLDSSMMGSYLGTLFKASDVVYLVTSTVFVWIIHKAPEAKTRPHFYFASAVAVAIFHLVILPIKSGESFSKCLDDNFGMPVLRQFGNDSNYLVFMHGCVRGQFYTCLLDDIGNSELSQQDRDYIDAFVDSRRQNTQAKENKNVVFVLLESFITATLDLRIGDFDVTPNLNRLKNSPETVFSGNMHQNTLNGESSDGQLIYMTGLLPLKNVITASKILGHHLVALPGLLRDSLGYSTAITIPTLPHIWHQSELNKIYGIDNPFAVKLSGNESLASDEELVDLALRNVQALKPPFFHLLLTSTTHSPYDNLRACVPDYDVDFPSEYSPEYCNYLKTCHYTDSLLGGYFDKVKALGLYDNTVFVIVSDHEAHQKFLNMEPSDLDSMKIPLIIVNSGIQQSDIVESDFNQIDVFPTLLDVMGLNSRWRGVGHSLIKNPGYSSEISDQQQKISEMIIKGNYFEKL